MKRTDENVAAKIRGRFIHAVVVCDDGNVIVKFPEGHKNDAESCYESWAGRETSDGGQIGEIIVFLVNEQL